MISSYLADNSIGFGIARVDRGQLNKDKILQQLSL